jgi:hypothetical protein
LIISIYFEAIDGMICLGMIWVGSWLIAMARNTNLYDKWAQWRLKQKKIHLLPTTETNEQAFQDNFMDLVHRKKYKVGSSQDIVQWSLVLAPLDCGWLDNTLQMYTLDNNLHSIESDQSNAGHRL